MSKPREHFIETKKKKSVDWSQYFGIDRRKKKAVLLARPGTQNQDDEWMLQWYIKWMASNLAKNGVDKDLEKRDRVDQRQAKVIADLVAELSSPDVGMKDEAAVQNLKDKLINNLVVAYSMEKMRKALNELRSSMDSSRRTQRGMSTRNNLTTNNRDGEYADEAAAEKRNCSEADEDCREEEPDTRNTYEEGLYNGRSCPEFDAIKNDCENFVLYLLSKYPTRRDKASNLLSACLTHQMCKSCVEDTENQCSAVYEIEAAKACNRDQLSFCMPHARGVRRLANELLPRSYRFADSSCLCRNYGRSRKLEYL